MQHSYSPQVLGTAFALMLGTNAMAVNPPAIAQELTDGDTYLLMNYARPNLYGTRTSWDGAYYLLNYENWKKNTGAWKPITFEAHKNDDGTWSFVYTATVENPDEEGEVVVYSLGLPSGSGNLKALNETETEGTVKWTVTAGDYEGYYKLYAGENNPNDMTIGRPLHLNGSGEYAIIYFEGNGWGFDIYGGVKMDEDEEVVYESLDDDPRFPVFNNYDHTNWAFIHEADIETYNAKVVVYEAIKDIEDNYLDEEGFEAGFKLVADEATAIYEAGSALDDAIAIIKAKKDFYEAIVSTIDQNVSDDAALNTAIEKAMATFNATCDITETANAKEALHNALKIYLSGEGDFTSFGQNMSFEDMSNQGGNTTTGVVNAPAGWNLYLGGKLCNTATEIKDAGVGAWCGINADATGAKDGQYIFGIWNNAMPKVELSQTIEGLENGTYLISAAVMVGANGGGSRMTTQRVFGNLNSALFGWEEDYNKEQLDPSEVYEYAGLTEPTTDTELQEMTVSAYVYDGTLTFGFRTDGNWQAVSTRDASNGAGGDGWFKVDNFRIQYMGYDASDAANILDYYQELLGEYADEDMQKSIKTRVEELISLDPAGEAAMNAAILECKDYMGTVKASIDAYKAIEEYLEQCMENIDEYADYAGIDDYEKAVMAATEVVDTYEQDAEGLAALRASLEEALTTLILSGVFEGKDVTNLIANPSFEIGGGTSGSVETAPEGWNLYLNGTLCRTAAEIKAAGVTAWCASNKGDDISGKGLYDEEDNLIERQPTDGDYLFGIWNEEIPEVELSQTISGLPAGTYTLTADVMVEWNWAGDCLTTQRIFANGAVCMFGYPEDYIKNATPDMQAAIACDRAAGFHIDADDFVDEEDTEEQEMEMDTRAAELADEDIDAYRQMNYARHLYQNDPAFSLLKPMSLKFVVTDDGKATIGFRTNNIDRSGNAVKSGKGWFKVDNFTLYYESKTIPTAVASANAATGKTEFYTLGGVRLSAPQRGVNIVRMADGSVVKVMVK